MFELIVVGGFLFWAYWFVLFAILLGEIANDEAGAATWTVLVGVALFWLLSKVNPFVVIAENWHIIIYYLLIGIGWSFFKWYLFGTKVIKDYKEKKSAFLKKKGIEGEMSAEDINAWKKTLKENHYLEIPKASEHKGEIACWTAYWPWSMLSYLVWDLIKDLYEKIVDVLKNVYQAVTKWQFRNIEKDFE